MSPSATVAKPFPDRANSLNLLRLILASAVLVAHAWYITGTGTGPTWRGENLGGWAVAGFFVLSGFLITRSRLERGLGDYLVHRVARIFPAFLMCLIVTAVIFGPIAALVETGSLDGYLSTAPSPLSYIWVNADLHIDQYTIGSTLSTVPYSGTWNGSLWTLYYEFCCYLIVAALGTWVVFRRHLWPSLVAWGLSVAMWSQRDLARRLGLDENFDLLARLLPYFLGGTVICFVVQRFGLRASIGAAALPVALVVIAVVPDFGGQLAAPALAYGLLWWSTVIPQPRLIARHDISYGVYVYAWPVQQLVELIGPTSGQLWPSIVLSLLITSALASVSWRGLERLG